MKGEERGERREGAIFENSKCCNQMSFFLHFFPSLNRKLFFLRSFFLLAPTPLLDTNQTFIDPRKYKIGTVKS